MRLFQLEYLNQDLVTLRPNHLRKKRLEPRFIKEEVFRGEVVLRSEVKLKPLDITYEAKC
jgi:hypothetical protein